jgi:ribosomal protein S18 acetylase RimI-like enzyme
MTAIIDASVERIPEIQSIAEKTWGTTYKNLLSGAQLKYMLDHLYADTSLRTVMENGTQKFILITEHDVAGGFASYGLREDDQRICKLHKLYILPQHQGKGFGKKLIDEIKRRLVEEGIHMLDLNVKRDNPAKTFYEKLGFKIIKEEDIPFGPYLLNDYVMRIIF